MNATYDRGNFALCVYMRDGRYTILDCARVLQPTTDILEVTHYWRTGDRSGLVAELRRLHAFNNTVREDKGVELHLWVFTNCIGGTRYARGFQFYVRWDHLKTLPIDLESGAYGPALERVQFHKVALGGLGEYTRETTPSSMVGLKQLWESR
jgi:hypothetical protein